jgi:hypothetical protein
MIPGMRLTKRGVLADVILGCLLLLFLGACTSPTPTMTAEVASATATSLPFPTLAAVSPTATLTIAGITPSTTPTLLPPDFWQKLPVIPETISDRVREIYQQGLAKGNNPNVFSRIGDCTSAAPDFLVDFDRNYNLGPYTYLQPAIDYFKGSFERPSLAAKAGLNSAGLLTTLWTGKACLANENLLDCQYRLDHPAFAIISIGTNEAYYIHHNPASFEINMRVIIEDTIAQGIVPILGTKADNFEGDNSINATIARLAMEYELPLWNFWLAAQPLPSHGMADASHLTTISYTNFTDFSLPESMNYGMQVRNLTALQMLNFLREQLAEPTAGSMVETSAPTP